MQFDIIYLYEIKIQILFNETAFKYNKKKSPYILHIHNVLYKHIFKYINYTFYCFFYKINLRIVEFLWFNNLLLN